MKRQFLREHHNRQDKTHKTDYREELREKRPTYAYSPNFGKIRAKREAKELQRIGHRFCLCRPVKAALVSLGCAPHRVVSAVESSLGEKRRNLAFRSIALEFEAWHGAIGEAYRIAEFEIAELPKKFKSWIGKFARRGRAQTSEENP